MNVKIKALTAGVLFFVGGQAVMAQKTKTDTATTKNIEEVVVTGYGTVNRETFVGTSAKVDSELLTKKNVSAVTQALTGEVAGVRVINTSGQPGTSPTIRVRGFGSVNGNRDPLIVLDGTPYDGNLSSVNPEDIDNMSVLKDATATAIYGARGANGVVVITTKKGKRNSSEVVLESKTGVNVSFLPRYDVIKSPEEFIGLSWQSLVNFAKYGGAGTAAAADPLTWASSNLLSGGSYGIDPRYNMWNVSNGGALIDPTTGKVRSDVTRKYSPENWEDYGFRTGTRSETNLSISGGADKTRYYSSFGYLKDEGYLLNSNFERYSARLNVSHQAKKWLSGGVNLGYTYSKSKNNGQAEDSGSIFWFVDNIPSIFPLFKRDANGNILPDPIYGGGLYDYGDDYARNFGNGTNAIADALYGKDFSRRHEVNGSANIKIDILPYLSFETKIGGNFTTRGRDVVRSKYYGSSVSVNGTITKYDYDTFNYTFLQMLRFDKKFGKHGVSAFAAHESTNYRYDIMYASKNNLITDGGTELNNASTIVNAYSYILDWSLESYFANLAYDYEGKYLFTGNVRRDGSSRFVDKDLKWGTFGSLGLGWVVSRENFLRNNKIFSNLKLKASYGVIGDQAGVGYYPGYGTYNNFPLNGEIATPYSNVGYPNLTWETAKIFQTGIEFSLFKKKIFEGSVEFYNKKTDNLIFDRRVPISLGYAIEKVNDGVMLNQGVEFTLNTNFLRNENAHIVLSINGEILKNQLKTMPLDPSTGTNKVIDVQGLYGWAAGRSIYDFYIQEWAGVNPLNGRAQWTVNYVDTNGNGQFDTSDTWINSLSLFKASNPDAVISQGITENYSQATLKYVGKSAIPKIRGGVTLDTGYKGFSLSTQFLYSFGGYAYDGAYASLMGNRRIGLNNWHRDMLQSWNDNSFNPNTSSDIPRLSGGLAAGTLNDTQVNSTSSRFLTKADYIVLNNVKLSYDVPQQILSNVKMTGLTLFVTGDNLWISTKRKGFNPSTSESGSSNTYRYSPISTFTFGIRAKF